MRIDSTQEFSCCIYSVSKLSIKSELETVVAGTLVLVIPALKKLRQEASHDFTVSLGFIASNRSDMNK